MQDTMAVAQASDTDMQQGVIAAVAFDLDGTLHDRDASLVAFATAQHRRLRRQLAHVPEQTYADRFVELDARGHVWKDEVYDKLVGELSIRDVTGSALLDDYLAHFHEHCVPFPHLHETLAQLTAAGLTLGIISNGLGDFQMATIRALGIEPYFLAICISEREGVRKPEAAIFRRALARLGTSADRAVFVGDHPVADIDGARRVGMRAVWKRDASWPQIVEADAVIDHLAELPALVRRLSESMLLP